RRPCRGLPRPAMAPPAGGLDVGGDELALGGTVGGQLRSPRVGGGDLRVPFDRGHHGWAHDEGPSQPLGQGVTHRTAAWSLIRSVPVIVAETPRGRGSSGAACATSTPASTG